MNRKLLLFSLAGLLAPAANAADWPQRSYYVYVCAESEDTVHKLRFGPGGLETLKTIAVGAFPADIEGPHGVNISPDGKHWFLSLAHGTPFGTINKFATENDEWLADVRVGMFPATMSISPATGLLYVVNFDLYGDMKPSSISVVETSTMIEVESIDVGIMPHGSRTNAEGTRLYSVNMMSDSLVEIDTLTFEVARSLSLVDDTEGAALLSRMSALAKPTWATPPTPAGKVYVAGNGNDIIYEIDVDSWLITNQLDVGDGMGPYNLEVTSDGSLLVATYKSGAHVGFWNLATGEGLGRVRTTRRIPHGIAISDDDRYGFVTLEGVGGEPGTVEVYDLETRKRLDTVDVGKQAGGIIFWKAEP